MSSNSCGLIISYLMIHLSTSRHLHYRYHFLPTRHYHSHQIVLQNLSEKDVQLLINVYAMNEQILIYKTRMTTSISSSFAFCSLTDRPTNKILQSRCSYTRGMCTQKMRALSYIGAEKITFPIKPDIPTYRQTDIHTDRRTVISVYRVASLLKIKLHVEFKRAYFHLFMFCYV